MPIIFIAVAAIFGLSVVSDGAKPGELLFPLDTLVEEVQATATFDNSSKANLRTTFAAERLREVQELVASGNAQGLDVAILNVQKNYKDAINALKAMKASGTINQEVFQQVKKILQDHRNLLKKIKDDPKTDQEEDELLNDADEFLDIEEDRLESLEDAKEESAEKLREAAEKAADNAKDAAERSEELRKESQDKDADSAQDQAELFKQQSEDLTKEADDLEEGSSPDSNSGSG
ncbi:MAG TPA: DUF5667 domain-containing protein, partial [Patescibacteria group bacterium]|nr:DUF5667 domain-containing protein [Patescibacteria group bacterium]